MKYRNTRTGAVIETSGKISGGNWQAVPAASPAICDEEEKIETVPAEEDAEIQGKAVEAEPVNSEGTPKLKAKTATKSVVKSAAKTGTRRTAKK